MDKCFNCGRETTRKARLNDNMQIDASLPFRPVCYVCGPKWEIIAELPHKGTVSIDAQNELTIK